MFILSKVLREDVGHKVMNALFSEAYYKIQVY
jgi:hypothetical protein